MLAHSPQARTKSLWKPLTRSAWILKPLYISTSGLRDVRLSTQACLFRYLPKWLAVYTSGCRYLLKWRACLSPRVAVGISPSARLSTSGGRFYSPWRCLSRGLPQGGVLCPISWLPHFNPLVPRHKEVQRQRIGPTRGVAVRFWPHADEVVCVMAHGSQPTLRLPA